MITDFNQMVSAAHQAMVAHKRKGDMCKLPHFLVGESMGGAVALRMIEMFGQEEWRGCILFSPMCKIDKSLQPHPLVVALLKLLNKVWPTLAIVPSRIALEKCFADPAKHPIARLNPHSYSLDDRYPRWVCFHLLLALITFEAILRRTQEGGCSY